MKKNDLDKKEILMVDDVPKGKNGMTSRALFIQRKLYDKTSFSSPIISKTKPIDIRYEKTFYGRTDEDARSIHLSETNLKQFPEVKETMMALNFVVDAFEDAKKLWNFLKNRNVLEENSPYANLKPKASWISVNSIYHEHQKEIFDKFVEYASSSSRDQKITGFDSFVNQFILFIDQITPMVPFTRSKFISSRDVSPLCSGLMIELENKNIGSDKEKITKFIEDPNFPIFKDSMQKFGFMIDKHVPWRIVFDIGSPASQKYLNKYKADKDNFIDVFYYKSYKFDIDILKSYIIEFYNSYVSASPTIVKPKITLTKNNKICVKTDNIKRVYEEKEELENRYDSKFWLRMYLYIRAREENLSWNQYIFEENFKNSYYMFLKNSEESAIDFIFRRTSYIGESQQKERNFHFLNVTDFF